MGHAWLEDFGLPTVSDVVMLARVYGSTPKCGGRINRRATGAKNCLRAPICACSIARGIPMTDRDRSPSEVARRMREVAARLESDVTAEALKATLDEGARTIEWLIEEIEIAEACL